MDYTIQRDLETGNSTAHNCQRLVIPQSTVNLLGRDTLQKLGIELTYTTPDKKILRRLMLDQQSMWNFSHSEPKLDIQYNNPENSDAESDTIRLARQAQYKQEKKRHQRETQQREARGNMEQNRPCEEMPGTSYTSVSQAIHYQAGPSSMATNEPGKTRKQAIA